MKVLASDFDNTLYFKNIDNGFYDCDIEAIRRFQSHGHLFGMCSGRPIAGLIHSLHGIIQPDFYIASTGAIILDKDYHLLYGQMIPFDIVQNIYQTYQDEIELLVQTLSMNQVYVTRLRDEDDSHTVLIHSIDYMRKCDIYSISFIESTVKRAAVIAQEINQTYNDVVAYQNMDSIDIVAKGCSKGMAIERLKSLYQLSKIAGIGDSYNDLPMIEVVDQSFTFKDAPQIIQNQCDYIVKTIAEAIEILEEE